MNRAGLSLGGLVLIFISDSVYNSISSICPQISIIKGLYSVARHRFHYFQRATINATIPNSMPAFRPNEPILSIFRLGLPQMKIKSSNNGRSIM